MIRITSLFCTACFFIYACGGSRVAKEPAQNPAGSGITGLENLNEDFDPNKLIEPPMPIHPKGGERKSQANAGEDDVQEMADVPKEIIGYRIQILQTEDAREAREFQQEALLRLDIDAYVSYDNPYYKVRIGDFTSRFEAEDFLTTLEGKGFKSAWIVRTLVVNPAAKATEEVKRQR